MEQAEKQTANTLQPETRGNRDSFALAALLILVAGFLEGYTYICRDKVFANGQTGNMAKLGIAIVDGDLLEVFQRAIPIIAFILGINLAMTLRRRMEKRPGLSWQQWVILAEMLALLAVSFIPGSRIGNLAANVIVSFVCGLQFETFRSFNGNIFASTFCTGNLRSATESLNLFLADRSSQELSRALGYFGLIALFILGTSLGALGTRFLDIYAALLCCGALGGVFLVMRLGDR